MHLLSLRDLSRADLHAIWQRIDSPAGPMSGTVGWSFEGNGIRTRTSFIQAFRELGLSLVHVCAARFHEPTATPRFTDTPPAAADVLITDGWPAGLEDPSWSLTEQHLVDMGLPRLLPTPPFSIGRELAFDPQGYAGFVGYRQKALLLPVQKAILRHAAAEHP